MARQSRPKSVPDVGALVEAARSAVLRDKAIARAKLGPPAVRAEIENALCALGFEATSRFVRVPVEKQIEAVLRDGGYIALKKVAAHVRGGTAAEAAKAASRLVERRVAKRALRTRTETLVPAGAAVLAGDDLAAASGRASEIAKVLRAASRRGQDWGVLLDDVRRALGEVLPASRSESAIREPASAELPRVLEAIDAARDPSDGLSFVPEVARLLAADLDAVAVKKALLEAAARGIVELRPEGGLGRLSHEELLSCPEGPQGSRLSWARRMGAP